MTQESQVLWEHSPGEQQFQWPLEGMNALYQGVEARKSTMCLGEL